MTSILIYATTKVFQKGFLALHIPKQSSRIQMSNVLQLTAESFTEVYLMFKNQRFKHHMKEPINCLGQMLLDLQFTEQKNAQCFNEKSTRENFNFNMLILDLFCYLLFNKFSSIIFQSSHTTVQMCEESHMVSVVVCNSTRCLL